MWFVVVCFVFVMLCDVYLMCLLFCCGDAVCVVLLCIVCCIVWCCDTCLFVLVCLFCCARFMFFCSVLFVVFVCFSFVVCFNVFRGCYLLRFGWCVIFLSVGLCWLVML